MTDPAAIGDAPAIGTRHAAGWAPAALALAALLLALLAFPGDLRVVPSVTALLLRSLAVAGVLWAYHRCARAARPLAPAAWGVALLVGRFAFDASCWFIPARTEPAFFGTTFAEMSTTPFAFVGQFPHRLLGPLLAHGLGLTGLRYGLFTCWVAIVWLGSVFLLARKYGAGLIAAAGLVIAFAATGTLATYKDYVGYADHMTFLLLTLTLLWLRHGVAFWGLALLNLCNHEHAFFLLPWLLCLRWVETGRRVGRDLIGLLLVLLPYVVFRYHVGERAQNQGEWHLTMSFYTARHYFPLGWLGLCAIAAINAVTYFGPLLSLLWWWPRHSRSRTEAALMVLFGASLAAIFVPAHDTYRFVNFLFLPMTMAAGRFCRTGGEMRVATLAALCAVMLLGMYVQSRFVVPVVVEQLLLCGGAVDPTKAVLVTCLWPKLWYVFAAYLLGIVGIAWIGRWLARRGGSDRSGDRPATA